MIGVIQFAEIHDAMRSPFVVVLPRGVALIEVVVLRIIVRHIKARPRTGEALELEQNLDYDLMSTACFRWGITCESNEDCLLKLLSTSKSGVWVPICMELDRCRPRRFIARLVELALDGGPLL